MGIELRFCRARKGGSLLGSLARPAESKKLAHAAGAGVGYGQIHGLSSISCIGGAVSLSLLKNSPLNSIRRDGGSERDMQGLVPACWDRARLREPEIARCALARIRP